MAERISTFDGDRRAARSTETKSAGACHRPVRFDPIDELKRRNIGRVAILYILLCWLALVPSYSGGALFDASTWGSPSLLLMILGFPAVLLLAWLYELTPEGIRRTAEVDRRRSLAGRTGKILDLLIVLAVAISLAYVIVEKFWFSGYAASLASALALAKGAMA